MSKTNEQIDDRPIGKVVRSVAWMMSGRVLRLVLGVGIYVMVARYLRPAEFGLLVTAIALTSILEIAGRLGLNQVVLRDVIRKPEAASEALGTVIGLRLICAVLGIVIATALGFAFFPDAGVHRWAFFLVALSLVPAGLSQSFTILFQSRTEARVPVLTEVLSFVLTNGARVLVLVLGGSLMAFALIPLLSQGVRALVLFAALQRHGDRIFTWQPNLRLALPMLRENWPMVFSQFAGVIYLKVDQVMLAPLDSAHEAGNYAAALRISEVWYFIPAALCISMKPALTRLREKNHQRYLQVLQGLFSMLTLLALGVAVPITIMAPTLVTLLFGAEFAGASTVLTIHIWTALFVFWRRGQSEWMINEGYLKFGLCRTLVGAFANIGLNLILIPSYGGVGAATATLISCFLTVIPMNMIFSPARPILALQLRSLYLAGLLTNVRRWTRPMTVAQTV